MHNYSDICKSIHNIYIYIYIHFGKNIVRGNGINHNDAYINHVLSRANETRVKIIFTCLLSSTGKMCVRLVSIAHFPLRWFFANFSLVVIRNGEKTHLKTTRENVSGNSSWKKEVAGCQWRSFFSYSVLRYYYNFVIFFGEFDIALRSCRTLSDVLYPRKKKGFDDYKN